MLYQTGEKYLRESQRTADTELPAVDRRAAARNPFAGLPFVRTRILTPNVSPPPNIFRLVTLKMAPGPVWSLLLVVTFSSSSLQRKVVNGVDLQVQRIATAGGIFGDILHFRITEMPRREKPVWVFSCVAANRDRRGGISAGRTAPSDGHATSLRKRWSYLYTGWNLSVARCCSRSGIPICRLSSRGAVRCVATRLCGDTECHLSGIHDRIGLIADKFGTEIVIPVVTEQGRDALAFGFELYDIEIISVAQKPVADVALDECVDAMP